MKHGLTSLLTGAALASVMALSACIGLAQAQSEPAEDPGYDAVAPHITKWMQQPAILVFSKTQGWRHNEGIAGADKFFVDLSRERGYGIFTTVNAAVFNADDLSRFEVVVFNNTTGDALSPDQEAAFQAWLEAGGAWIGLHGSGDNTHADWPWYANSIIGPTFTGHPLTPHFHIVRVETLDAAHPVMADAPEVWRHDDEWYFFDSHPRDYGLRPLAGIHEDDFEPTGADIENLATWAMGATAAEHPIIWVGCPGAGRSFYSAIGHSDLSYEVETYRQILFNAFDWVTRKTDEDGAGCPDAGVN
ncbi:MAG: ThuA domain-containing protein [Pseudomonadota bacterium]|nr:ThuA domain-containing protein [Pseudomonadota bacterium]